MYFRLYTLVVYCFFFFFQAEDGIRDYKVTGVQTCALPIYSDRLERQRAHAALAPHALPRPGHARTLQRLSARPAQRKVRRIHAAMIKGAEYTCQKLPADFDVAAFLVDFFETELREDFEDVLPAEGLKLWHGRADRVRRMRAPTDFPQDRVPRDPEDPDTRRRTGFRLWKCGLE